MKASASEIIPDFVVSEEILNALNAGTTQELSIHHATNERTFVEAFKLPDAPDSGWYSFSWQTDYTSQETATLIAGVDEILGITAMKSSILIATDEEVIKGEYVEEEGEQSLNLSDLGVDQATNIRFSIEGCADILWEDGVPGSLPAAFAIITCLDIESKEVQAILKRTVADEAAQILDQRLSTIADVVRWFMQTPFGEPSTPLGFTPRA